MIPPRSFVSSVYCAWPGSMRLEVVREQRLEQLRRSRPSTSSSPMCDTSNTPASSAHRPVLLDHALVLHRHLPAGERHHPRTEGDVAIVQRRAAERLLHRRGCYSTPNSTAGTRPCPVRSRPTEAARGQAVFSRPAGTTDLELRRHVEALIGLARDRRLGDGHRLALLPAAGAPVQLLAEAGGDDGDAHLLAHRRVDHGAEDDVRVRVRGGGDDLGRLVDLEQADVGRRR